MQGAAEPHRQFPQIFTTQKRTHLDKTRVDQDTRAERVQDPADDTRRRAVRVVRRPHAKPDGDT